MIMNSISTDSDIWRTVLEAVRLDVSIEGPLVNTKTPDAPFFEIQWLDQLIFTIKLKLWSKHKKHIVLSISVDEIYLHVVST